MCTRRDTIKILGWPMLVKMRVFITCRLTGEVRRWEHKAKLDPGEPDGCGYPVCAIVDGRPKGPFIKDVR